MDATFLHSDAAPIERGWAELCQRSGASPFLWPGWDRRWRSAFARGRPRYLTAVRDDRLVGVLALEEVGGVLRSAANEHTPVFQPVALDDRAMHSLASGLATLRPVGIKLDELQLTPAESQRWAAALSPALPRQELAVQYRSPYLDLTPDWTVFEQRLGRSYRKDARRRQRRAAERGELSNATWTSPDGLTGIMDTCMAVEASGWKGQQGSAMSSRTSTRRFYQDLTAWLAARGWLRLELLRLDAAIIAFELHVQHRGIAYAVKVGYDDAHRDLGPGSILTEAVTRRQVADPGLYRAEWLGSDEDYKLRWADGTQDRVVLEAYRASVGGYLWDSASRSRRQVRSWAQHNMDESTVAHLRSARSVVKRSRERLRIGRSA